MGTPAKLTALCVTGLALAAGGCGGGDDAGSQTLPGKLTVYSSLPLEGASRKDALTLSNGEKLALEEKGGRAGRFEIDFKLISDASAQTGNWDVGQVSANARKALSDPSAIAYLGEFNSGATAISLPILNRGAIPQVTQSSSTGLTVAAPGTAPGEPDKYYPTGKRHIIRMTSRDDAQGIGLAELARDGGGTKLAILNDKEVYGIGLGASVKRSAEKVGLPVVVDQGIDPKAPNYRSVTAALASKGVDAVVFAGCTANNAVQLFKDLSSALPSAKLYGGDCLLDGVFYADDGGIPQDVQAKTILTAQLLPPERLTAEGKQVIEKYTQEFDGEPSAYAVYGYESMALILHAVEQASKDLPDDATITDLRKAVIEYIYTDLGTRESALGPYKVDENGDASIPQLAAYKLDGGKTVFYKNLKPTT